MKYILTLAAAVAVAHTSTAAFFADQVISYAPGTGAFAGNDPTKWTNDPIAALGSPSPIVGSQFTNVLSAFSPAYEKDEIVSIGSGGHLTLQLSHFVNIDRTQGVYELGVWENVGAVPNANDKTDSPPLLFGPDSAVVEVSADGVNWFSLNGNAPILFTMPGIYFTNAGQFDAEAPANPQIADFGKPFTGSVGDLGGKSHAEIVTLFNGSAGGTWLNLDSAPLDKVGFVRFSGVAEGQNLEIDAVAINTSLAGNAVPEPSVGLLAITGIAAIGTLRRKRV